MEILFSKYSQKSSFENSGASAAATYAVMEYMGKEGYTKLALEAMEKTKVLKEGLLKIGYELVVEPELNIIAFNHPNIDTNSLAELLEEKNWSVSVSSYPKAIRIILMNHVTLDNINDFLNDLKIIANSV